eukprot:3046570-Prymnesium_polylepis.1
MDAGSHPVNALAGGWPRAWLRIWWLRGTLRVSSAALSPSPSAVGDVSGDATAARPPLRLRTRVALDGSSGAVEAAEADAAR